MAYFPSSNQYTDEFRRENLENIGDNVNEALKIAIADSTSRGSDKYAGRQGCRFFLKDSHEGKEFLDFKTLVQHLEVTPELPKSIKISSGTIYKKQFYILLQPARSKLEKAAISEVEKAFTIKSENHKKINSLKSDLVDFFMNKKHCNDSDMKKQCKAVIEKSIDSVLNSFNFSDQFEHDGKSDLDLLISSQSNLKDSLEKKCGNAVSNEDIDRLQEILRVNDTVKEMKQMIKFGMKVIPSCSFIVKTNDGKTIEYSGLQALLNNINDNRLELKKLEIHHEASHIGM